MLIGKIDLLIKNINYKIHYLIKQIKKLRGISMDIIALLLFLGVIIIAFVRKNNAGILALAIGVIAVRILEWMIKNFMEL